MSAKQLAESVELAKAIFDHANQVSRYARLQKGTDQARQLAREMVSDSGELKQILSSFKRSDKDGAVRQEILKDMRFEL